MNESRLTISPIKIYKSNIKTEMDLFILSLSTNSNDLPDAFSPQERMQYIRLIYNLVFSYITIQFIARM